MNRETRTNLYQILWNNKSRRKKESDKAINFGKLSNEFIKLFYRF